MFNDIWRCVDYFPVFVWPPMKSCRRFDYFEQFRLISAFTPSLDHVSRTWDGLIRKTWSKQSPLNRVLNFAEMAMRPFYRRHSKHVREGPKIPSSKRYLQIIFGSGSRFCWAEKSSVEASWRPIGEAPNDARPRGMHGFKGRCRMKQKSREG